MISKWNKYKILIPNSFTALSLILGLIALQLIFEGDFVKAAWLIAVSMICDFLDGKIARLLNAMSKFGATFDTLADFVAFGVVPGFLAYKSSLYQIKIVGFIVVVFYVFAGGYRLVRFTHSNMNPTKKHPFTGLPIPAAAGTISSFIIVNFYLWDKVKSPDILLAVVFISAILMISKIEYLPLDKGYKLTKETKLFICLGVLSAVVAFWYPYIIFISWIIIYILYGIVRHFILALKKKQN